MKINKAYAETVLTKHILQNFDMAPEGLIMVGSTEICLWSRHKTFQTWLHSVSLLTDSFHNCQPPSTYYRGVISSGKVEYLSSLQQKCVHIINGA